MALDSSRRNFSKFLASPIGRRDEDSGEKKGGSKLNLRVYLELLGSYRRAFVYIFFAACLTEILYLAVPVATRYMIDGVIMNATTPVASRERSYSRLARCYS